MSVIIGQKEYFKDVKRVGFEGRDTDNPFSYKFYDENKMVFGKPMKDHFNFAVAYWHSFVNTGNDPFGVGTKSFPWASSSDPYQNAYDKMDAAFEFISKLGINHFCFHDFDLIDEGDSIRESENRLNKITSYAKEKIKSSDIKVLWGTANLFSHPRYFFKFTV